MDREQSHSHERQPDETKSGSTTLPAPPDSRSDLGAAPPSGTVTFLFTDIEGSTRRWEAHPAEMVEAVRTHDRILREAVAAHEGDVFKTGGDAFCIAFAQPQAAIAAAIDAQRSLSESDFSAIEGLHVRMAVNTGTADERDGDYFGPPLNRVARLLAVAHGAQVLVSSSTADLARDALPPGVTLLDLGVHGLRDLARSEHVYQLVARGLKRDFPALRSRNVLSNNLPAAATPFVGRSGETAHIADLLERHRLVTVVGPGGIGKTRSILEVARHVLPAWHDGVWLVELAQIADGGLVVSAVSSAVGLAPAVEGDALAALTAGLGQKQMLLVLDNCEHVLADVARTAAAMLRACPNVHILASSRQPLAISGEAVYRMPGLGVPHEDEVDAITAEHALRHDAIALFIARAQAADTRFVLGEGDAPAVARICRRLDGIPLAIELAAARIRLLGVEGLQCRLTDRFRLLVAGGRDAVPRQQTLRAAIDWSHELLDEREQTMFRRLGIFVDGFTPAAAAFVAGESAIDEDGAFELLSSLEDKSLITVDVESDVTRFALLESMRAYALERIKEHSEHDPLARRHLTYLRALAEGADASFVATGNESVFATKLAPELNDVRAALDRALAGGDVDAGSELVVAMGRAWSRLGLSAEGIARLEAFIGVSDSARPKQLARLWTEIARLQGTALRSTSARDSATRGVHYARLSGDSPTLAWSLAYLALAAARLRQFDEAEAALDEADALTGEHAPAGQRANVFEVRAFIAQLRGDFDRAAGAFAGQAALLRSIGDEYGCANVTVSLAETEHARGNTRRAIELIRGLPDASRLLGREAHAGALANLAGYLLACDDVSQARAVAQQAIQILASHDPSSVWVTIALEHYALALALDGDAARAARLEGYCEATLRAIGFEREISEGQTHRRLMHILEERLDGAERTALFAEGAALSPSLAIAAADEALILPSV